MGSRGDIQPALALACGLQAAGHHPIVSAPPDFGDWSRELNLPFVAAGDNAQQLIQSGAADAGGNPIRLIRGFNRIIREQVYLWFTNTLEAARDVEIIISSNQFIARSIAEAVRVPFLCSIYAPTVLRSNSYPPAIIPWQHTPKLLNGPLWWSLEKVLNRLLPVLNRQRAALGLGSIKNMYKHMFDGAKIFLAADPIIAPLPRDSTRYDVTTTGPWFYEDRADLDPEIDRFINSGSPPIYVGFGSMPSKNPEALTRAVLDGATANGRRVLLSKGWAGLGGGDLPSNVFVAHQPMPHAKLFPRLAAVVHHGGSGTTATAARAGIPQVIVPHLMDQYYFADRMVQLKLAAPPLPIAKLTASGLAAAIECAIKLPPEPRRETARRLQNSNGVQTAVERISDLNQRS